MTSSVRDVLGKDSTYREYKSETNYELFMNYVSDYARQRTANPSGAPHFTPGF